VAIRPPAAAAPAAVAACRPGVGVQYCVADSRGCVDK
jgi:hypothetical protein